jgi:hypothetical protein
MPRDPAQQLEFGSPDFDLVLSVVSAEAALAAAQGVGGEGCLRMLWRTSDGLSGGSGRQGFESTFKACLRGAFTDTEVIVSARLHPARSSGCLDA